MIQRRCNNGRCNSAPEVIENGISNWVTLVNKSFSGTDGSYTLSSGPLFSGGHRQPLGSLHTGVPSVGDLYIDPGYKGRNDFNSSNPYVDMCPGYWATAQRSSDPAPAPAISVRDPGPITLNRRHNPGGRVFPIGGIFRLAWDGPCRHDGASPSGSLGATTITDATRPSRPECRATAQCSMWSRSRMVRK
jgi:hypothetical protein